MAQRDIIEVFNDCLDRLNNGATVADCVRLYPQYADDLRIMLESGRLVNRARIDPFEIQAARERGRTRVQDAFLASPPRNNIYPFRRFLTLAATVVLILGVFLGGAGLAAESSLPGDPLYGLKRLTENTRLMLPGVTSDLQESFAQRRIGEIRQLLAINRVENVTFSGEVETINDESWRIAGLSVVVPVGTAGADSVKVSDVVSVQAHTTAASQLIATSVLLVEAGDVLPTITPTQVPTIAPTQTPSPTITFSPTPITTPTPTFTPIVITLPTVAPSPLPESCTLAVPQGWVSYQVATGDTLSGLASATGVLIEEIIEVNCLETTTIFVGQILYLPFIPQTEIGPGQNQPPPGAGAGGSTSGTSGSDDSSDDDDDNSGSGRDDDDDHDDSDDDDDEDRSGSNSGPG